jgi:hypothetical protein
MSEEEAGSPPVPDDKPFFAIDVGDLSEEPEVSPTASDAPPTPMMMGSLSGSISPAEDSAPADQTNPNPWTSTGPQLTGDVSEFSGQAMYAVPPMDKKEGFRWRHFFLGLFVPYIALTLLFVVEGAFQEDWDDVYRGEDIILDSEDNRTFETTLSPRSNEFLSNFWASHNTDDGVAIDVSGWSSWESDDPSSIYQFTYANTGSNESEIGTYYPSNNTVYFVLENVEINRLYLYVEYADVDAYNGAESGTDIGEFLFCLLPIAYVAGTIAAFVKGNNALAYGLLTALPLGFVIFPLLFFLLLVFAFGIY